MSNSRLHDGRNVTRRFKREYTEDGKEVIEHIELLTTEERQISYHFDSHFHPFAGRLMQKLIREGVAGLQDIDTPNDPTGKSLPGGVEVEIALKDLQRSITLTLAKGTSFELGRTITVNAGTTEPREQILAKGRQLTLAEEATVHVLFTAPPEPQEDKRIRLIVNDSLATTPSVHERIALEAKLKVSNRIHVEAVFPGAQEGDDETAVIAPVMVELDDGARVNLMARIDGGSVPNLPVIVLAGSSLVVEEPVSKIATVIASRPRPDLFDEIDGYSPQGLVSGGRMPNKELDFSPGGPYSVYNWELFFHVPLSIAIHLTKNQRFAEAQRWFHFIFDPTDDTMDPHTERFWKFRPFHTTDVRKVEDLLTNLVTDVKPELRDETIRSINAWKAAPFRPHVIARVRQQAYMYKTVMAYLDNLIAWGDSLFRKDTGESVDEAMMVYVLAAGILGPRPQPIPKKGPSKPQTYKQLKDRGLKEFGSVMRDIELEIPFDRVPLPTDETDDEARAGTLRGLGRALYFCVPRNEKLLRYWDTVADRLFKIRNSLNLRGEFRQLPLFEPPIDPALLARAKAAGLDLKDITGNDPKKRPQLRFQVMVQKALETAQEAKSLGASFLSAMEKEDGETMALLRSRHERLMLENIEQIKYGQFQEAVKAREGVVRSLISAVERYVYYERQLGRSTDEILKSLPELDELDEAALKKMKFRMREPEVYRRDLEIDIAQDLSESQGKLVSSYEAEELRKSAEARDLQNIVRAMNLAAKAASLIPDKGIKFQYWGIGGDVSFGGTNLGGAAAFAAEIMTTVADLKSYEAQQSAKIGGYARREQEWAFQSNVAANEINQNFNQLRAAQIREALAEMELRNHRGQMKNAEEIEQFLNEEGSNREGKRTNKALYVWMKGQLDDLYRKCCQLAFDVGKEAEFAFKHELGEEFKRTDDLDLKGKEGLLVGEKLYLDIKGMEMKYLELNKRRHELTKHISLLQIAPFELLRLRRTGRCEIRVREELFDMDGPGHYLRRIKSVAISIPCVAGPFTSVNCKLTLKKSSIRQESGGSGEYARKVDQNGEYEDDGRFDDVYSGPDNESIMTSSASNDSGMFEMNLRDERYLPFENAGVISTWELQLPGVPDDDDPIEFDYETISDVILHMSYTACDGGDELRKRAKYNLKKQIKDAGQVRLFSIRHEFPNAWEDFKNQAPSNGEAELSIELKDEHYPFWSRGRLHNLVSVEAIADAVLDPDPDPDSIIWETVPWNSITDQPQPTLKRGKLKTQNLTPTGVMSLKFNPVVAQASDLWLAVTWNGT